ncbi:hypothetical protein L6164_016716 [Bauhinia variegata]|uniref:Uncharacterized protein n=1 Tax=Bauhinia variegata TaxID=167791 RepID=A0ACB9N7L1_BAUVA|nr:hypothetical protein L6164_016716 [Bauhinia variegata]
MASLSEAPHMESFMSFPSGFKFCPTDQELIYFYLRKKVNNESLPTNPIREVNIYLYNPVDLLDEWVLCKIYERRKGLEDAKDNDQTQLSTLSQYLLHPLHQLLPQVPSELPQKPQQTPPPPSHLPQLVTSPPLYMDAHKVNTYSVLFYNPQPVLLSPPPLSQPQHTQMIDSPPQDA